ncbi:hypothetical protein OK074_3342 [Actinobacteria bacterium OK074]|nr:hypothetical protein OK074_3342 [Actinobacteria bacterium OK074]
MMPEDRRRGRGSWTSLATVLVALSCVLTACGGGGDDSEADSAPPRPATGSPTDTPSESGPGTRGAPGPPSATRPATPSTPSTRAPASRGTASTSPGCVAGSITVTHRPGDALVRGLCVRPGTVVSLVLRPRNDDKRWTGALSSAPVFVLASGWEVGADGTARVSLRCAGTRGGTADVTVSAKAPDVAGAARIVFTLHMSVVPYTTQG